MSYSGRNAIISPLGDSALLVQVAERYDVAPERVLRDVLLTKARIEQARIPGVIECTSAYTTVGVFYDPAQLMRQGINAYAALDWLCDKIREALSKRQRGRRRQAGRVDIPVLFEGGVDLERVAAKAKISCQEVVEKYCAAEYLVSCVGFTPGFPFLSGLPKELATPRRDTPRKEVPAGSVAIGGEQAGIYPISSPGGWNIIGQTTLRLFDPLRDPPTLLQAGDHVRFHPMTREEFSATGAVES